MGNKTPVGDGAKHERYTAIQELLGLMEQELGVLDIIAERFDAAVAGRLIMTHRASSESLLGDEPVLTEAAIRFVELEKEVGFRLQDVVKCAREFVELATEPIPEPPGPPTVADMLSSETVAALRAM